MEEDHSSSESDETLKEPLDLMKMSLNEQVLVKLKGDREVTGRMVVSDSCLRMHYN